MLSVQLMFWLNKVIQVKIEMCKLYQTNTPEINTHILADCRYYLRQRRKFLSATEIYTNASFVEFLRNTDSEVFVRTLYSTDTLTAFGIESGHHDRYIRSAAMYVHEVTMSYTHQ